MYRNLFYATAIILSALFAASCDTHSASSGNGRKAMRMAITADTPKVNVSNENMASSADTTVSETDSIVYSKIEELPEVNKIREMKMKEGDRVSLSIAEKPGVDFIYYWVQVGLMHPERFEPLLNFYVTPDKFEVLYFDTTNDTTMTLKQWRKNE